MEFSDHNVGRWQIIVGYYWQETQNRGAHTLFIYLHHLGVPAMAPCANPALPCAACLQVTMSLLPICPPTPDYLCNYQLSESRLADRPRWTEWKRLELCNGNYRASGILKSYEKMKVASTPIYFQLVKIQLWKSSENLLLTQKRVNIGNSRFGPRTELPVELDFYSLLLLCRKKITFILSVAFISSYLKIRYLHNKWACLYMGQCHWPLKEVPGRLAPLLGCLKDDPQRDPAGVFYQRSSVLVFFVVLSPFLCFWWSVILSPAFSGDAVHSPKLLSLASFIC